jgi:hypothetical protein
VRGIKRRVFFLIYRIRSIEVYDVQVVRENLAGVFYRLGEVCG